MHNFNMISELGLVWYCVRTPVTFKHSKHILNLWVRTNFSYSLLPSFIPKGNQINLHHFYIFRECICSNYLSVKHKVVWNTLNLHLSSSRAIRVISAIRDLLGSNKSINQRAIILCRAVGAKILRFVLMCA